MKRIPIPSNRSGDAELRRRAERRIGERDAADSGAAMDLGSDRLLHELEVQHVELQMQNEELRGTRLEVEAGLERYTELFDFAPIGYLTVERDSTIHEANLAGARLLGLERGRLVGRRFLQFVREEQRTEARDFIDCVMNGEESERASLVCEVALCGAGAEERDVLLTGSTLGGPEAFIAIEDITARKRAEEALRAEARNREAFLAILSHELRNPLAPIRNSILLLERAESGCARAREARAIIDRQVTHLTHIVDDLLDRTRIAQGKILIQHEPVELCALVRSTLDDHRASFVAGGVALESHVSAEPMWVSGEATRLVQVLGNLLRNAVKFTLRGGKVDVTLRRDGLTAMLMVSDTGVGIAPDLRGHLFEPFVQAPQMLDRAQGGLGLGLAVSKGVIELHGGKIAVASPGLGFGSTFTVTLPVTAGPAKARPAHVRRESRHHRVLVIEDNVDAANTLRDVLSDEGQDVKVAYDGFAGLALARDFQPAIVICDLGLPGMDGYAVARAFRADRALKGSYLVALSGYALAEDRERARDAGFDRHIAKPTSLESLERLLMEAPVAATQ